LYFLFQRFRTGSSDVVNADLRRLTVRSSRSTLLGATPAATRCRKRQRLVAKLQGWQDDLRSLADKR
jgi:hypothetical protein